MIYMYVAIDCGPLTDPTNGRVDTSSGTTFMSAVVYSCSTGYNLEIKGVSIKQMDYGAQATNLHKQ